MEKIIRIVLKIFWIPAFAGMTVLWFLPALAEDTSVTYAPDNCQFSMTFPGEPYITRRCDDENKSKCYDQVSYTQVFDMAATVNFRVICNPIGRDVYENYSAEVMEATLRAMTNKSTIKTYDTSFREDNGYKQAGLVGEGRVGQMGTIFIAQLWIADGSALSVEAELLGDAHDKADTMFSDVLKSIHFVSAADKEKAEKAKDNGGDDQEGSTPAPEKTSEPSATPDSAPSTTSP